MNADISKNRRKKKVGRPRSKRVRVVLKLLPRANDVLEERAYAVGWSKGQYLERLLFSETGGQKRNGALGS
jgi:hypothetical protein